MSTEDDVFNNLKYRVEVHPYTGTRRYYNAAGQLHRENDPAVVFVSGTVMWFQNGLRHREDGPAIIYPDGDSLWYLCGVGYSKHEYYAQLKYLNHGTPN